MNINITTNGVGSETEGGSSENRKYMFAGEYVDIDKENAYTKIKWANLKFITISA